MIQPVILFPKTKFDIIYINQNEIILMKQNDFNFHPLTIEQDTIAKLDVTCILHFRIQA